MSYDWVYKLPHIYILIFVSWDLVLQFDNVNCWFTLMNSRTIYAPLDISTFVFLYLLNGCWLLLRSLFISFFLTFFFFLTCLQFIWWPPTASSVLLTPEHKFFSDLVELIVSKKPHIFPFPSCYEIQVNFFSAIVWSILLHQKLQFILHSFLCESHYF